MIAIQPSSALSLDGLAEDPLPVCPECGAADPEYLPHESDCPDFIRVDPEEASFFDAVREYEDEA